LQRGLKFISKDVDARMEALGDLLAESDYDVIGLQEVSRIQIS